jgi:hypothetical protein
MICHIPREENGRANTLVKQAFGYKVMKKNFHVRKPMHAKADMQVLDKLV